MVNLQTCAYHTGFTTHSLFHYICMAATYKSVPVDEAKDPSYNLQEDNYQHCKGILCVCGWCVHINVHIRVCARARVCVCVCVCARVRVCG